MKTIKIWMISLLIMVGLTNIANAGPINTFFSSVNYDKTYVSKGTVLTISMQLVDSGLNPVTDANPQLEFKKSNGDIATELDIVSTEINGNIYKYAVKTNNTVSDEAITITPYGNYVGSDWKLTSGVVTFEHNDTNENGAIDPDNSSIIAEKEQVIADGVDSTTITVTLHDEDNNPIINAAIVPSQSYNGSATESIIGNVVEHANGVYTFSVRSNTVEQVTYSVVATATYGNNQTSTSTETIAQQDNEATVSFVPSALPNGVRIDAGEVKYIVSVYDQDYAPYHKQFTKASYDRPVDADGLNDGNTIDIQGVLTTAGQNVALKYHSNVSRLLPAYKAAYNVPAEHTEDGQARRVVFSYPAQYLHSGNGVVNATIKSTVRNLNAKKLDINAGIGNGTDRIVLNSSNNRSKSVYGVMLSEFDMAINANGDKGQVQLRIMVGIPDRRFGQAGHNYLYLPKQSSGKTWLNNNLEADYANLDSPYFNLAKQATSKLDTHAFGSYFATTTSSDICPRGYGLPTTVELDRERMSWGYYNRTANGAFASPLNLTAAGLWNTLAYAGYKRQYVGWGRYLSSSKPYAGWTSTLVYNDCFGSAIMQNLADVCVKYLRFSARCVKK